MSLTTKISWTDHTFNIVWGCTKISPGCANCYAATLAKRFGWDCWAGKSRREFGSKHWEEPLGWDREAAAKGKLARVFCGSMCDWLEEHPAVDEARSQLWNLIERTPHLIWQLLSKRADRLPVAIPPENWDRIKSRVWLGVSIENSDYAWRADYLRRMDSAVRFVSYEPALGPLDNLDLTNLDWIIYGGESGLGHRAENKQWARSMRDQCRARGVKFFHKQSSAARTEQGIELDGQIIHEFPKTTR